MAPSKSARNAHEEKVEGKDKEKPSVPNGTQSGTKMRRGASQASHARDQAAVAAAPQPPPVVVQETAGIQWQTIERKALHKYRREYSLDTPLSFSTSYHHIIFARPGGIGIYSPTMARRRKQNRQTKEQLAAAVRKHFNGVGVQENDVIVDLIHAVHNQGNKTLKHKLDDQPLAVELER
ncbi:unnamed protein product [Parascedosporium putredinis]|uniref:Histone deacetylase complex subunit SAP30 Sin3 binding domain-containing protein n=1 Tax=Parascedosporium putredinis TaxID=1442378 RepID=A0A9P1M7F8_9PEZI|nr:unnamed protein product [Parascedosporium putredinis]CAI7987658.1 unnamed protein product [Parascedosporium putredinis]